MISTFTALFDANVLYGTKIRSLLMELAMSGLFRARWTEDINREWMEAVHKNTGIDMAKLEYVKECMNSSVIDCCVTGYEGLIPSFQLPDPNDRHVLAAAVRCGASAIVTFNEKDFPEEILKPLGIHTRHPDDFLIDVEGLDQGALSHAAKRDFAHYVNPPLTADQYVKDLKKAGLPKTAEHLDKVQVIWSPT